MRNAALLAVSVVVAVALLEGGTRAIVDWRRGGQVGLALLDPLRSRELRPYVMLGSEYRDGPAPLHKSAGEYRIFVLGGSTVYLGSPPIPRRVEELLRERSGRDVRVYNYGLPSQSSGQELARLVYEIRGLRPDHVVMYDGGNDIMDPFLMDPRPGYPYNHLLYERNPLLDTNPRSYPAWTLWLFGSAFLRTVAPGFFVESLFDLRGLRREVGYQTPEWRRAIARSYVGNVANAQTIAQAYGARFQAFLQPLIYFKHSLAETEARIVLAEVPYRQLRQWISPEPGDSVEALATNPRSVYFHANRMRELVLEEAKRHPELNLVDLSDLFSESRDEVFVDYIHVRQRHRELAADAIASHLAGDLGAPGPSAKAKGPRPPASRPGPNRGTSPSASPPPRNSRGPAYRKLAPPSSAPS